MQQTEHLKLNIIEGGDPVDWEVMNENFKTLEGKVVWNGEAVKEVTQSLEQNGKVARVAWGSYTGTGQFGQGNQMGLTAEFYPVLLFIHSSAHPTYAPCGMLRPLTAGRSITGGSLTIAWSDTGVAWYNANSAFEQMNISGQEYFYVLIGYDNH